MAKTSPRGFYKALKPHDRSFDPEQVRKLLAQTNKDRVTRLANDISTYIVKNLPKAIDQREGLAECRTNPYVLLTSASVMRLIDPNDFASFLFNNKLYMGLETSFGKSIESVLVLPYPFAAADGNNWQDPPEKIAESCALARLGTEEKAQKRIDSVWREIDKSCIVGSRRYMLSIKSGPSCINDTQVKGMTDAIGQQFKSWKAHTDKNFRGVKELHIIIGLTYGTDRTTNNKENQILVKLLQKGFVEEDRATKPGVLIDAETHTVRVYRKVGIDFWSFVGNPGSPGQGEFVYLEVLLALADALSQGMTAASLEERVNAKILQLSQALAKLNFPRNSLPDWVREKFKDYEITWLAAAMSAFYDK